MSWSIPTRIEEDFISGRAQYRTFQTGNGGQSILPVPSNSYVVIFGYDFSPAGGGFESLRTITATSELTVRVIRQFETQQISFYTGTDFYPFIHHVNAMQSSYYYPVTPDQRHFQSIDNTPIARQLYITSSNDVTITHGLIIDAIPATTGAIPVTSRTPSSLTYGGSFQLVQAQTNYGPLATPQQFIQPSPKDFQDFGLGLLPNNATDQAFAAPDGTNGLIEANVALLGIGADFVKAAACNYYLCVHYALYSSTIPEQRG